MVRHLTRLWAFALAMAVASCATTVTPPRDLTGIWGIRFSAEDSVASRSSVTEHADVVVAFLQADSTSRRLTMVQGYGVTHLGLFSGELGPLAPGLRDRDQPSIAAGVWGRDSVLVVFNPDIDHGALRMEGVRRDSTVSGRWYHTSDNGRHGSFVMRRKD